MAVSTTPTFFDKTLTSQQPVVYITCDATFDGGDTVTIPKEYDGKTAVGVCATDSAGASTPITIAGDQITLGTVGKDAITAQYTFRNV